MSTFAVDADGISLLVAGLKLLTPLRTAGPVKNCFAAGACGLYSGSCPFPLPGGRPVPPSDRVTAAGTSCARPAAVPVSCAGVRR